MVYMKFTTLELDYLFVTPELVEADRAISGLVKKQVSKRKFVEISYYLVVVLLAHTLVHSATVDFSADKCYYYAQKCENNKCHDRADN